MSNYLLITHYSLLKMALRYLLITVVSTTLACVITAAVLLNILTSPVLITGAAFVAGFFVNFLVAGTVALAAGRRAGQNYIEPSKGQVAGTLMGFWVGVGAIISMVIFLRMMYNADVRGGLVIIFGLVSCGICIFAARIAGREAAHPPEEEE